MLGKELAILAIWALCCAVMAETNSTVQSVTKRYSHAEMCLPMSTGLIREVREMSLHADLYKKNSDGSVRAKRQGDESCTKKENEMFRTVDGSCNNKKNLGQSSKPIATLLDPAYQDAPRQQTNLITSFVDASQVYGSNAEVFAEVRDQSEKHLLKTSDGNFMPDSGKRDCVTRNENDICFLAGDDRNNEQPALTMVHTVFVRYHNYLAKELRKQDDQASQETTFQQARAIVGAVIQNILYSHWLPVILGPSIRRQYGLDLNPKKPTKYRSKTDPRIFSAFSTAVFRFGHTLIPPKLPISPTESRPLRDLFFKPFIVRENIDTLVDGLAQASHNTDRTQPFDTNIVSEVTKHLFENQEGAHEGFDLVALNIQRGRDHGLPSYNSYREAIGLPKVTSFSNFTQGSNARDLASVYDDVNDIDLFSGGLAEASFDGGLMGETFSHLAALQFQRLRYGDRFFFDIEKGKYGFPQEQVAEVRKVSLPHILCLTTELDQVQRDIFKIPSEKNPRLPCKTLIKEHPSMAKFTCYPDRKLCKRQQRSE